MQAQQIRQHYRQLRRSLTSNQQQAHAIAVSEQLDVLLKHKRNTKIAAYLATQAELSLNPWIASAAEIQQIFLPMLYEPIEPRLRFAPYDENTRWKSNRFGIIEPDTHWGKTLHARQLDIILLPLVAFDRRGHRLGMGGGFYDRSLAFRTQRQIWKKPLLVGIAHSCQEHPGLHSNPWDVTLDWMVTEQEIIPFSV
ncbi:MAG: 5-formyltetrahydrofolate cyclo-ligase [Gammaproteobacteria bacterium]|nr:5-formyltetrahydrofolate cyclo-ligase [Gammaproteobacteria bacterium]